MKYFFLSLKEVQKQIEVLLKNLLNSSEILKKTTQFWEVLQTFEVKGIDKMNHLFKDISLSFDVLRDQLKRKKEHFQSSLFRSLMSFQNTHDSFSAKLEEIYAMKKKVSQIERNFCSIDPFVIKKRQGVSLLRAFLNQVTEESFERHIQSMQQSLRKVLNKEIMKDLDLNALEEQTQIQRLRKNE